MWILYGAHSETGPVRSHNEDCVGVWHPSGEEARLARGTVAVLADGVGGHEAGEVASRLAVDVCLREFATAAIGTTPNQILWRMFNAANLAVFETASESNAVASDPGVEKKSGRMATTLLAAIFRYNEITIAHVGDARAYLFRDQVIRQITTDHTYAGVQIKLGLISPEEAAAHPHRSILTRSVGLDPLLRVDYHRIEARQGDRFLQCCDGIYAFLTEGEIFDIVIKNDPKAAAEALAAAAIRRGGDDNVSAQVIHVTQVQRPTAYKKNAAEVAAATSSPVNPEPKLGTELQPGDVLDRRYEITDLVSRSGMAQIFKARDKETAQTVAIKIPLMQFESDPGFFARFEREQQIGLKLTHPSIIRIEPVEQNRSRPYIVMEYLQGQTLAAVMRAVGQMPENDAAKIGAMICDALHYMHENHVVHRDLKPDNIMVCNDGSIRIMDFGIAKVTGMRRLTFGGFTPAMGTPDYMAPEQVRGKRGDGRTDIYSLGAILYEMVTGKPPFEGSNPFLIMNARLTGDPVAPRTLVPNLSPQMEEIILHAMARDPTHRYQDARQFRDDLSNPAAVKVTGRADALEKPQPWKASWRRLRLYVIAVGLPLMLVAAAFLWIYVRRHLQWK